VTRRLRRVIPLFLSLAIALVLAEVTLRIAGFHYELKATVIEAQAPNRERVFEGYALDPDLLWTRKDYPRVFNAAMDLRPDILFMGDSCTEFGDYDRRFARLVAERFPAWNLHYANFGCAGWSTFQGRRQMERDVRRVRPRFVTLYYGWNDHWLSVGVDDKAVAKLNASALYRLRTFRLAQLATKAYVAAAARRAGGSPPRVSEVDFRDNVEAMIRAARAAGAVPILLTAPTSGWENEGRWTGALSRFPAIHRRYAAIVREVAAAEGVFLCDIGAEFDRIPREEARSVLFFKDEVHLTDQGNQKFAESLVQCFADQRIFESTSR
jgi:lysophospholipase L1-like esterase